MRDTAQDATGHGEKSGPVQGSRPLALGPRRRAAEGQEDLDAQPCPRGRLPPRSLQVIYAGYFDILKILQVLMIQDFSTSKNLNI